MKKEVFITAISDFQKQHEKDIETARKLSECYPESRSANLLYDNHLVNSALLRVLTDVMQDKEKWIEYFCFELEFGKKNNHLKAYSHDKKEIPLKNSSDLYDFLITNKTSHL